MGNKSEVKCLSINSRVHDAGRKPSLISLCQFVLPLKCLVNLDVLRSSGTNDVIDVGLAAPAVLCANKLPIALFDKCQN